MEDPWNFCYALMFDGMSLLAGNFGYTDKEFWILIKLKNRGCGPEFFAMKRSLNFEF